ncbi:27966_t:CDS:1, partial [Racocetra persica]
MIPPCPRCGKDDFKKTRDQKAHLKRKFKYKPKPIPQIKDQVIVQDLGTGSGPATQAYREKITSQNDI